MGVAQIIEAANCKDLRGAATALLGKVRCSSSQPIRYAVLEWTGTADSVTSDVVNSWTNSTFTAGQFFSASNLVVSAVGSITPAANTITDFNLPATLGSTGNNLIVLIWTEGTAAQNVTLDVAWQFAKGDLTGQVYPIEVRSVGVERSLCQRYYQSYGGEGGFDVLMGGYCESTTLLKGVFILAGDMRVAPSMTVSAAADFAVGSPGVFPTATAVTLDASGRGRCAISVGTTGLTLGRAGQFQAQNTNARLRFNAEL